MLFVRACVFVFLFVLFVLFFLFVKVCAALAGFQGDLGVQYMGCGAVGNLSNSNTQVRKTASRNAMLKQRVGVGSGRSKLST